MAMLQQVIDRRLSGKNKSIGNRERFLRRYREQIGEAVRSAVSGRSIRDIEQGDDITLAQARRVRAGVRPRPRRRPRIRASGQPGIREGRPHRSGRSGGGGGAGSGRRPATAKAARTISSSA